MRIKKRDVGELVARVKDILSSAVSPSHPGEIPSSCVRARRVDAGPSNAAGSKVRLMEISQAVGLSPSHLAAIFKRTERTTIHQYLVNLRLRRAASLLAECDDLTTLALNLGFASQSHFSNSFRRWAGCTPGKYRARMRAAMAAASTLLVFERPAKTAAMSS
jgi:AraC-like DNA-binding protein